MSVRLPLSPIGPRHSIGFRSIAMSSECERRRNPYLSGAHVIAIALFLCHASLQFTIADEPAVEIVPISGKVIDENGNPASGVSVHIYLGESEAGTATTDTDGRYALPIAYKNASISVVDDDLAGDRQGYYPGGQFPAAPLALRDVRLKPARHTLVKVVDASGEPVAGATVAAPDSYRVLGETFFKHTTDEHGVVQLRYFDESLIHQIVAFKSGAGLDYFAVPLKTADNVILPQTRSDVSLADPLPRAIILRLTGSRS